MSSQEIKRLGLLVPPLNTTMEDDFAKWMPNSVRLHVNRLYHPPGQPDEMERSQAYGDHLAESTRLLAKASVDVIAFGCTSGSFLNGLGYDQQIVEGIREASGGVKAVATARAVVDALNELGVRRIAACSPYGEETNRRLTNFYTDAGFEIVSFDAVDQEQIGPSTDAGPEVALNLAKGVDRPEAEAIFISCTAFRGAAEAIEEIEEVTGKPVVTSNQATFWACLRQMGVEESVQGAGILMREAAFAP